MLPSSDLRPSSSAEVFAEIPASRRLVGHQTGGTGDLDGTEATEGRFVLEGSFMTLAQPRGLRAGVEEDVIPAVGLVDDVEGCCGQDDPATLKYPSKYVFQRLGSDESLSLRALNARVCTQQTPTSSALAREPRRRLLCRPRSGLLPSAFGVH